LTPAAGVEVEVEVEVEEAAVMVDMATVVAVAMVTISDAASWPMPAAVTSAPFARQTGLDAHVDNAADPDCRSSELGCSILTFRD
jgi:hypothetical protein